jgi:Tfp pilus assembly protein PilP
MLVLLLLALQAAAPAAPSSAAAAPATTSAAAGQPPAPAGAAPAKPAAPGAPAAAPAPVAENYTYQPAGRRDPFVNLLGTGVEARPIGKRAEGAAGLTVGEIALRGIISNQGRLIAMVAGADKRTYIVHPGDKLVDGTIRTITADGLVISQEVTDPLSLVKQREVRKSLRAADQTKE